MSYRPADNVVATIFLVGKLQKSNMLWILKGTKRVENICYMNVIKDPRHQQMCRPKKEKRCTTDAKTNNKKTQNQTISNSYKHGTMLAYLPLLKTAAAESIGVRSPAPASA
jgi:hypothetical protein